MSIDAAGDHSDSIDPDSIDWTAIWRDHADSTSATLSKLDAAKAVVDAVDGIDLRQDADRLLGNAVDAGLLDVDGNGDVRLADASELPDPHDIDWPKAWQQAGYEPYEGISTGKLAVELTGTDELADHGTDDIQELVADARTAGLLSPGNGGLQVSGHEPPTPDTTTTDESTDDPTDGSPTADRDTTTQSHPATPDESADSDYVAKLERRNEVLETALVEFVNATAPHEQLDDPDDAELLSAVREAGETVADLREQVDGNSELLKMRNRADGNLDASDKYLSVIERAEQKAERLGQQIARLTYTEVAEAYGCSEQHAYTVMKDMPEDVPGVFYKETVTRGDVHDLGVSGKASEDVKHVRVELEHPALKQWRAMAREETT